MKAISLALFLFVSALGLSAQTAVPVRLAAAANLASIAQPLEQAFQKAYPQDVAEFTFGSSGALVAQIENGAPFDIFLSADMGFAQKLAQAGFASSEVKPYALGKLVLFSTKHLNLARGLNVLTSAQVNQIANCNPQLAPYGKAAEQALQALGLWESLQAKIVTAQDIAQALQFTLEGTDAGFVNLSALLTPQMSAKYQQGRDWVMVDPHLYQPIQQGFVEVKGHSSSPAVADFEKFLFSSQAQKVFVQFGYGIPQ